MPAPTTPNRLPMRGLAMASLAVVLLVMASTAVLYVQLRQSADDTLLARGLDRATGLALAARSMPLDDGVLARLAEQLVDATVLHAAVLGPDGQALGGGSLGDVEPSRAARLAAEVVGADAWRVHRLHGLLGAQRFELWYPLALKAQSVTQLRPGPPELGTRVLLLVLDPAAQGLTLRPALVHFGIITALLAALVALTVQQMRQAALQRARQAQEAQEQRLAELGRLSAVLAHEIRNPLGAIKGFAQLTKPRFAAEDPAAADMDVIVAESARLERLVETLLRYARPMELHVEACDLREVLEVSARLCGEDPASAPVVVEPGPAVPARVDRDQLSQALVNILRNAVQASAGAGEVRARVWCDGERAVLQVDDSGPGVAPELRASLFEPWFTTKATGTGIGLAVTRRIVEAHGGRIEVDAAPGGGARFAVSLPLTTATTGVVSSS